jgi:hypothetical protein
MVDINSKNFEFRDESEYENKEGLSIKEIILRHLRKISDICCQEFTGGYWLKKPIKTAGGIIFTETYYQDIREAYCNAIDFLIDVLYPSGDKDFKKYVDTNENIDKEEEDIKKRIIKKRKTFKEMNLMFDRINFWTSQETINE